MSYQLDYTASKNNSGSDFGTRNATINMRQPLNLSNEKSHSFRIIRIILSNSIPNIYNYGGFDSSKINISNDGGTNWYTIVIDNGVYTLQMIEDVITDAFNQRGWLIKSNDPAITLNFNPASQMIYTKIDSSKLETGGSQAQIDFSVSKIADMLGYTSPILSTDGLHTAQNVPQLDSQGSYIDVYCSAILGSRYVNGNISNAICRLPILSADNNEIIFPSAQTGSVAPILKANIPSSISSYEITFKNQYGRDAVFLMGNAVVELELID